MAANDLVTEGNLGPEFNVDTVTPEIALRLGPGLLRNAITGDIELDIVGLTTEADSSVLAAATVSGDSNQPNTILTLTGIRADNVAGQGSWSNAGNAMAYTGSPDHVDVHAHVTMENAGTTGGKQRIAPVLELLKNGAVVARSMTGYQRHFSGHGDSSNSVSYTDPTPGTNPVYELRAQQGGNQNDVELIDLGTMSAKAVHRVPVISTIQLN